MAASTSSPSNIINQALVLLGHPGRVGNLFDGSMAAKKALDVYAQTRDEVLQVKDWPFALRQVAGSSSGSPPVGWAYSWTFPTDCLRVRSVLPSTLPSPNNDPQPTLFTVFNNGTTRLILTQFTPIAINYTGQITDMAQWPPLFVGAVVEALASKLGPSLRQEIAPSPDPVRAVVVATGAGETQAPDDAAAPMPVSQQGGRR